MRLVAVNTANQLAGVSEAEIFTTSQAAQAPTVTIGAPSAITAHEVKIVGTVNPQEDTADWRVQTSTDPACATGFQEKPLQLLSPSANSPVNVEYEVTGLLPSEHYCARILATNSAGSTTSSVQEFATLDALPTSVFTSYAAPRTDTTARLNGLVNPEGSAATYRFEYSENGSSWLALPDEQTPEDRQQITVAGELIGLQPGTTYHYRFVVENGAGEVEGEEKTFTTHTSAEVQLPQRGVELVNKPNKGNQSLAAESPAGDPSMVRADGEKVIWRLNAGAPGGNTGASVNFLSTRSTSGWTSQSLAPTADEQFGGGSDAYKLNLVAPDFRTFLMRAAQTGAEGDSDVTLLRIDDQYHQEALFSVGGAVFGYSWEYADMTNDGAHVIGHNPLTDQLEELGAEPEVVSVMPDGQPAECGVDPSGFYGEGNSSSSQLWRAGYHRMDMNDASRLYFQAMPNGGSCTAGPFHYQALYYRDRNVGQTVEIDPGTAPTKGPGVIRATPDGRSVYFVTESSHLAEDANEEADVYRWDSETEAYACLTCGVPGGIGLAEGGGGVGLSRVLLSDDFSHLYFSSDKQLVPGYGPSQGTRIYSLDLSDGKLGYVTASTFFMLNDARLSNNGKVLLFKDTVGGFTADQQPTECASFLVPEFKTPCEELYRYEEDTGGLECLSCLPGGVTTNNFGEMHSASAMSADGSTVAFVTKERLRSDDINRAPDVYEWHNGAVRLISDGESEYPSESLISAPRVYGMDSSGDNLFYSIVQPGLTGYEQDKTANLYDARVGGGFPRPVEPAHCSEESCQGPLQAPPAQARTGSAGLSGSGNVPAAHKARCAGKRGKARSRCLHRHKKHKKHHKRHKSRRHHGKHAAHRATATSKGGRK